MNWNGGVLTKRTTTGKQQSKRQNVSADYIYLVVGKHIDLEERE